VAVRGAPDRSLLGSVAAYYGFEELSAQPMRRREGPGRHVVLVVSFGEEWLIDGERVTSFAGGLHERQVTTEHAGRSFGMHVDLTPPAAHRLSRLPLHVLANSVVPLDEFLGDPSLPDRLWSAGGWEARFRLLDELLARRLAAAPPAPAEVDWAWQRLVETDGRIRIGTLTHELGWSRKRLAAAFREHVGLPPKKVARLLRFDRARSLAAAGGPDWTRIAVDCGYYDQSHLINEFRTITGRTPETFFQDETAAAA
jgi:AraC-like DNA-binding protein